MNKTVILAILIAIAAGVAPRAHASIILYSMEGEMSLTSIGSDLTVGVSNYDFNGLRGASDEFVFNGANQNDWAVGDKLFYGGYVTNGINPEFAMELDLSITNTGTTTQMARFLIDVDAFMSIDIPQPRDLGVDGVTLIVNDGSLEYFGQDERDFINEDNFQGGVKIPDNLIVDVLVAAGETVSLDQNLNGLGTGDFTVTAVPEPSTFLMLTIGSVSCLIFRRRKATQVDSAPV